MFQKLTDQVPWPHNSYAVAYLDNAVFYSWIWEDYLKHVTDILQSLKVAGLTVNPTKCHQGKNKMTCLNDSLGKSKVQLFVDKVQVLLMCPMPTAKKQGHHFVGLAGYYRTFFSAFALISPIYGFP